MPYVMLKSSGNVQTKDTALGDLGFIFGENIQRFRNYLQQIYFKSFVQIAYSVVNLPVCGLRKGLGNTKLTLPLCMVRNMYTIHKNEPV